jgi:hypothetical protein
MPEKTTKSLSSIADIRRHFAENERAYYFVSATNFNLMNLHEWVRGWQNINLLDCFDGQHPQVMQIADDHSRVFEGIEEINLYLLNHPEVRALFEARRASATTRSQALFLFFNEALEALCQTLKIDIALPPNGLIRRVDSKIVTTEIGNQAGVYSVPNVLTKISSYAALQQIAAQHGLGERWVVQTAYGDSGKTTFFIASESDYRRVAKKIEAEDRVKVMRRVNCTGTAIEACTTRWGTFVGPLLTELIGIESLTPYPGGWCGNELYGDAFSADIRRQAQQKTEALGNALYQCGYRGYFEVDYLIDLDSSEVYLGELNARITGISAMTNMSDFSAENMPLFLFHLLEYEADSDPALDLTLDAKTFNQSVLAQGASGTAAQVILKYTDAPLKIITEAPVSGVYTLGADGSLRLKHAGFQRRDALAENEAYVLRILRAGEYAYRGGDLAIMFINQVIREPQGALNPRGEQWVGALRHCFRFRQLNQEERSQVELTHNPANIKSRRES